MPLHKNRKRLSKNSHSSGNILVLAVVSILLFVLSFKITDFLMQEQGVLGISTLLARGGDGESHGGQRPELANTERVSGPDAGHGSGEINREQHDLVPTVAALSNKQEMNAEDNDQEETALGNQRETEHVTVATDGGSFEMPEKHLGALSHFPISINPETNELIITTPAGTKTVAVLPDQAVENILNKGIISKIGGHIATGSAETGDTGATESGSVSETTSLSESTPVTTEQDGNVLLTMENGGLVYKVKGSKSKKLLGLIPVSVNKTVTVSAETGVIESTQTPAIDSILDILSI